MNLAEEMYELATNPPKQLLHDEYAVITKRIKTAASNGLMGITIMDTNIHIHEQVIERLGNDGFNVSFDYTTDKREFFYIITWNMGNTYEL